MLELTTSTALQNIGSAVGTRPSFINSGKLRQKQRRKSEIKEKNYKRERRRKFWREGENGKNFLSFVFHVCFFVLNCIISFSPTRVVRCIVSGGTEAHRYELHLFSGTEILDVADQIRGLRTCIRQVLGSNLGPDIWYTECGDLPFLSLCPRTSQGERALMYCGPQSPRSYLLTIHPKTRGRKKYISKTNSGLLQIKLSEKFRSNNKNKL